MNTVAIRQPATLQPPVSAALRLATAVAVAAILALAWIGAEQASHQAVHSATNALSGIPVAAPLPTVEIVGRREAARSKQI